MATIKGLESVAADDHGGFTVARVSEDTQCQGGMAVVRERSQVVPQSSDSTPPLPPVCGSASPPPAQGLPFLYSSPCASCEQGLSVTNFDPQALLHGKVLFWDDGGAVFLRDIGSKDTTRLELPPSTRLSDKPVLSADARRAGGSIDAAADHSLAVLWDASTGLILQSIDIPAAMDSWGTPVALSADGERMIVASGSRLLWNGQIVEVEAPITALAVPKRGADVVVGTFRGDLILFKGGGRAVIAGAGSLISQLIPDDSGRLAATLSYDGSLQLWDLERQALLATFVLFEDDEWASVAPNGVFYSSLEGADRVAWQFPGSLQVMRLSQYPALRDKEQLERQLSAGTAQFPQLMRAPTVTLSGTPTPLGLRLHAQVSSLSQVRALLIFVEGRPSTSVPVCGSEAELDIDLTLPSGPSRISALALGEGDVTSPLASLEVERELQPTDRPELWVLGVGIAEYPLLKAQHQLHAADADARALAAALARQVGPGELFRRIHPTVLTNAQATRGAIQKALSKLEAMRPEDLAVILISAHGSVLKDDGRLVLLTSASGPSDESVREQGILWEEIAAGLRRLKGRVLVLLDACHAGASAPDLVFSHGSIARELLGSGQSGVLVAAASKGRQLSQEGAWNGLFTGSLLMALSRPETDLDGNGWLEFSEVFAVASSRVVEQSQGLQTPWIARQGLFGELRIARTPAQ